MGEEGGCIRGGYRMVLLGCHETTTAGPDPEPGDYITAEQAEQIADVSAAAARQDAEFYTDTELGAHETDTTAVHGISDTAALETQSGAQTKADAALAAAIADAVTTYLALTGGTISGNLEIQGDVQARGATAAETALEARVTGDAFPRVVLRADGRMVFGDGTVAPATTGWYRDASGNLTTGSYVAIGNGLQADNTIMSWRISPRAIMAAAAGGGFSVKEGANARMGAATLVGGTVVIANTSVTADTKIFLTCQTPGGTPGFLRVSARTAGTDFTILSSSPSDTSVVGWFLVEPA